MATEARIRPGSDLSYCPVCTAVGAVHGGAVCYVEDEEGIVDEETCGCGRFVPTDAIRTLYQHFHESDLSLPLGRCFGLGPTRCIVHAGIMLAKLDIPTCGIPMAWNKIECNCQVDWAEQLALRAYPKLCTQQFGGVRGCEPDGRVTNSFAFFVEGVPMLARDPEFLMAMKLNKQD